MNPDVALDLFQVFSPIQDLIDLLVKLNLWNAFDNFMNYGCPPDTAGELKEFIRETIQAHRKDDNFFLSLLAFLEEQTGAVGENIAFKDVIKRIKRGIGKFSFQDKNIDWPCTMEPTQARSDPGETCTMLVLGSDYSKNYSYSNVPTNAPSLPIKIEKITGEYNEDERKNEWVYAYLVRLVADLINQLQVHMITLQNGLTPHEYFTGKVFYPANTPSKLRAVGVLKGLLRERIHKFMYGKRRLDCDMALRMVKNVLGKDMPPDLKVVIIDAGLPTHNHKKSEEIIAILCEGLLIAADTDCTNGTILGCLLHEHLATLYSHMGDTVKANLHIEAALNLATFIDDVATFNTYWSKGWLLKKEKTEYGNMDTEKMIDDYFNKPMIQLQEMKGWFRAFYETHKMAKTQHHLKQAQYYMKRRMDPKKDHAVFEALQRASHTLNSTDVEMLTRESTFSEDPFWLPFYHHLHLFIKIYQSGDCAEEYKVAIDQHKTTAFEGWMSSKRYDLAKEIAELLNCPKLNQRVRDCQT